MIEECPLKNASTWSSNAISKPTEEPAVCHALREDSVSMTCETITQHTNTIKLW